MSDQKSVEEQRQLGLRRNQNPNTGYNFVPAEPARPNMQIMPAHETHMQVSHPATQEVIVTTNAVDRAKGFQWMITPIAAVLAVLALLLSFALKSDLLIFTGILIFWATFAVVYVLGWVFTALATPEAVSFFSAAQQWSVIKREQRERWDHYKWQVGRESSDSRAQRPARPAPDLWSFLERHGALIIVSVLAYALIALWVVAGLGGGE